MDDILIRYLRGESTRAECDQVMAWLRQSEDNRTRLRSLEEVLVLARSRDERMDPGEPPIAADLIRMAEKKRAPAREARRRRNHAWTLAPLAVAASAAFVALGFLGYGRWSGGAEEVTTPLAAEEVMTGAGESTTVRMRDGSVVRLGPDTRLQMMSGGSQRQVVLVGRAFFAVTPDEERPFLVHIPNGSIRVLGTRFQLEADVEDTRLVVVEGRVALTTSGSEVQVQAGEMAELRSGRLGTVQKVPVLAELSGGWMGQFLAFQGTPLSSAAKEIEDAYGVDVRILDSSLSERTLTMWFTARPLEDILTVICTVIDAACTIDGSVVSIAARSR